MFYQLQSDAFIKECRLEDIRARLLKGGFPLFAETTRSDLASTRHLAEQFLVIAS